jgi:hypothetical protein
LSTKPKRMSVFGRADMAGAYLALRLEGLRSDPSVLAIRHTAAKVESSTLLSWQQRQLDAEMEALVFDADDLDARAVERMSSAAFQDDAYRVQLLDLAALHGGLYRKAVDALYKVEVRTLGRFEAEAVTSSTCGSSTRHASETCRRTETVPSGVSMTPSRTYASCVSEEQLIDVTFLVGEWMPILELADMLDRERAEAESPESEDET